MLWRNGIICSHLKIMTIALLRGVIINVVFVLIIFIIDKAVGYERMLCFAIGKIVIAKNIDLTHAVIKNKACICFAKFTISATAQNCKVCTRVSAFFADDIDH